MGLGASSDGGNRMARHWGAISLMKAERRGKGLCLAAEMCHLRASNFRPYRRTLGKFFR